MINRTNTSGNSLPRMLIRIAVPAIFLVLTLSLIVTQVGASVSGNPGPGTPAATQDFQDVPPTNPFYEFIHQIGPSGAHLVDGYTCGESGEPCVEPYKLPYYRPGSAVTRAQMSKYVQLARTLPGVNITSTTSALPLYAGTTAVNGIAIKGESPLGIGVQGVSSTGVGVSGSSVHDKGVSGYSTNNTAVYGTNNNPFPAVQGRNLGSGPGVQGDGTTGNGVYGVSTTGNGVYGFSTLGYGVSGSSSNNTAVYGTNNNPLPSIQGKNFGSGPGVQGEGTTGNGVYGISNSASGSGVYGYNQIAQGKGVYGYAPSGVGVWGKSDTSDGVHGETSGGSGTHGVYGAYLGSSDGAGIYGYSANSSGYAGYFQGRLGTSGMAEMSGATTKIDHPLDPANKYLSQSFVESPDMMNIYNGNVTTDANGRATVTMPDYVKALNQDFRYQLTVMGSQFAQAIVETKMRGNSFTIKTDKPNVEVSWQVTGIRQDPYAQQNRISVEQEKPANEKGYYIHPELYGQPQTKNVDESMRGLQP